MAKFESSGRRFPETLLAFLGGFPWRAYVATLVAFLLGHWLGELAWHWIEPSPGENVGPPAAFSLVLLAVLGVALRAMHHVWPRPWMFHTRMLQSMAALLVLLTAFLAAKLAEDWLKNGPLNLEQHDLLFVVCAMLGLMGALDYLRRVLPESEGFVDLWPPTTPDWAGPEANFRLDSVRLHSVCACGDVEFGRWASKDSLQAKWSAYSEGRKGQPGRGHRRGW